jgi:hypothetical protein
MISPLRLWRDVLIDLSMLGFVVVPVRILRTVISGNDEFARYLPPSRPLLPQRYHASLRQSGESRCDN